MDPVPVRPGTSDALFARTIVLPNNFYAGYEALAARLAGAQPGTELPAYVAPQAEVKIAVKAVTAEQLPTPSGPMATRRAPARRARGARRRAYLEIRPAHDAAHRHLQRGTVP